MTHRPSRPIGITEEFPRDTGQPLQPGLDGAWLTTGAVACGSTGCVFVCLGIRTLARQGLRMICSGVCAGSYAALSVAQGGTIIGLPGPALSAAKPFPAGRAYSLAVTPARAKAVIGARPPGPPPGRT